MIGRTPSTSGRLAGALYVAISVGTTPATAPVLSPAYVVRARISTGERLIQFGYRVGTLLVALR